MAEPSEPDKRVAPAGPNSGKGGSFESPNPQVTIPPWVRPAEPVDHWQWHITETFKGLITLSTEVVKMLALVNGGAAVALLAYLGNVAHNPGHPPHLTHALMWFCTGLFATLLAVIFAHLTQLKLYNEERAKRQQNLLPESQRKQIKEHHGWILAVAILLALLAAIAFLFGCFSAARAIATGHPAASRVAVLTISNY
jgi:phosphate/sulfate permease